MEGFDPDEFADWPDMGDRFQQRDFDRMIESMRGDGEYPQMTDKGAIFSKNGSAFDLPKFKEMSKDIRKMGEKINSNDVIDDNVVKTFIQETFDIANPDDKIVKEYLEKFNEAQKKFQKMRDIKAAIYKGLTQISGLTPEDLDSTDPTIREKAIQAIADSFAEHVKFENGKLTAGPEAPAVIKIWFDHISDLANAPEVEELNSSVYKTVIDNQTKLLKAIKGHSQDSFKLGDNIINNGNSIAYKLTPPNSDTGVWILEGDPDDFPELKKKLKNQTEWDADDNIIESKMVKDPDGTTITKDGKVSSAFDKMKDAFKLLTRTLLAAFLGFLAYVFYEWVHGIQEKENGCFLNSANSNGCKIETLTCDKGAQNNLCTDKAQNGIRCVHTTDGGSTWTYGTGSPVPCFQNGKQTCITESPNIFNTSSIPPSVTCPGGGLDDNFFCPSSSDDWCSKNCSNSKFKDQVPAGGTLTCVSMSWPDALGQGLGDVFKDLGNILGDVFKWVEIIIFGVIGVVILMFIIRLLSSIMSSGTKSKKPTK
jgi:hypothetical protein